MDDKDVLPSSWFAKPAIGHSDMSSRKDQVTQYLMNQNMLVVYHDKLFGKHKLAWVKTSRFLYLVGSLAHQLIAHVPINEVVSFLNRHPLLMDKNDHSEVIEDVSDRSRTVLVAVMPFDMNVFTEFVRELNAGKDSMQTLLAHSQMLDVLCRSDSEHLINKLAYDVRSASCKMIGLDAHVDDDDSDEELSDSWQFDMAKDPYSGTGSHVLKQIVGVKCVERSVEENAPNASSGSGSGCKCHSNNEDKDNIMINKIACASDVWFRSLVNMDKGSRHQDIVPLKPSTDNNNNNDELVAYSIVDLEGVCLQKECRALIGILRFFLNYGYTGENTLNRMCLHPILAHAWLINPRVMMPILNQSLQKNHIRLKNVTMMVKQCAKTEINNYIRLALPVSLTLPIFSTLEDLRILSPLSFHTVDDAKRLLDQFVGGYLERLDLTETIITGSALALSTILTTDDWKRRNTSSPNMANQHSLNLYPCLYTDQTDKNNFNHILHAFRKSAEFRCNLHKIVSVVVDPSSPTKITGWKWTTPTPFESQKSQKNGEKNPANNGENHDPIMISSADRAVQHRSCRTTSAGMICVNGVCTATNGDEVEQGSPPISERSKDDTSSESDLNFSDNDDEKNHNHKERGKKSKKSRKSGRKTKHTNWLWSGAEAGNNADQDPDADASGPSNIVPGSPPRTPRVLSSPPPAQLQPPMPPMPHPRRLIATYSVSSSAAAAAAPAAAAPAAAPTSNVWTLETAGPGRNTRCTMPTPRPQQWAGQNPTDEYLQQVPFGVPTPSSTARLNCVGTQIYGYQTINRAPVRIHLQEQQTANNGGNGVTSIYQPINYYNVDTTNTTEHSASAPSHPPPPPPPNIRQYRINGPHLQPQSNHLASAARTNTTEAPIVTADNNMTEQIRLSSPQLTNHLATLQPLPYYYTPPTTVQHDENANAAGNPEIGQYLVRRENTREKIRDSLTKVVCSSAAASVDIDVKSLGVEKKVEKIALTADDVLKEMICLDEGETLQSYLDHVLLDWTFIEEKTMNVLSCKFSLRSGADLNLLVLTSDDKHLERVAIQHYLTVQRVWFGAKLIKLSAKKKSVNTTCAKSLDSDESKDQDTSNRIWYSIVDPGNLSRFRVVTIYAGGYGDVLRAPVGMTRAGYTKADHINKATSGVASFFGSPTYALSAFHSQSPNYTLDPNTFSKEPKNPHEFLLKYQARGFGLPKNMQEKTAANRALTAYTKQHSSRWPKIQPNLAHHAYVGHGNFNIATILDS